MASRTLKKAQRRVTRTYRTLRDGDEEEDGRVSFLNHFKIIVHPDKITEQFCEPNVNMNNNRIHKQ